MISPRENTSERSDGLAHRLLGRHVADRSRPGAPNRLLGDLGDSEIREPERVVGEQQHVLRLDVAVDDLLPVGIRSRFEHLLGQSECRLQRHPFLEAVGEGAFPERQCDHEVVVDERRILQPQDVGVLQPGSKSDFVAKVLEDLFGQMPVVGDLQRNADPFDRIHRLVDGGKSSVAQAALDPVFAESLTRLESHDSETLHRVLTGNCIGMDRSRERIRLHRLDLLCRSANRQGRRAIRLPLLLKFPTPDCPSCRTGKVHHRAVPAVTEAATMAGGSAVAVGGRR